MMAVFLKFLCDAVNGRDRAGSRYRASRYARTLDFSLIMRIGVSVSARARYPFFFPLYFSLIYRLINLSFYYYRYI